MDQRMLSQYIAMEYKKEMIGKKYRHFKGGIYVVIDIAIHSETNEAMVIYQTYDEPCLVWARPLKMFLSKVDREKYPDVKQESRFVKMN